MITELQYPRPPEDAADAERRAKEAAELYATLAGHGAVFTISDDGYLRTDLNPCVCITDYETADVIARAVIRLSAEIKALIRHRRSSATH
jgi:hypothetical protein